MVQGANRGERVCEHWHPLMFTLSLNLSFSFEDYDATLSERTGETVSSSDISTNNNLTATDNAKSPSEDIAMHHQVANSIDSLSPAHASAEASIASRIVENSRLSEDFLKWLNNIEFKLHRAHECFEVR